jgi:branched-chain amino acid transport system permease protein
VNLGHAAFFGLGALVARTLWIGGTPIGVGMLAGTVVAVAFALLIGVAAFRLRGAYFAIGTLALGEILRSTVTTCSGDLDLARGVIGGYRLTHRYYLALALAALSIVIVAWLASSRLGLGMQAIRDDEEAAEAPAWAPCGSSSPRSRCRRVLRASRAGCSPTTTSATTRRTPSARTGRSTRC